MREHLALEQRVAERTAELGESEAQLNLALEASELGLWDWDLEHDEIHHSRLEIVFGIGRTARLRLADPQRPKIHPDDLAHVRQTIITHLKGETDRYSVQYRALMADGRCLWMEDRGRVIERADTGRALRMIGTRRDVSEAHRQAEQQRLAATVFEAAGEGMAILDANFRLLAVNDACCALSGYARDELVGSARRGHVELGEA